MFSFRRAVDVGPHNRPRSIGDNGMLLLSTN